MHRNSVRCALLYPPLTDPTCGYHSLSYLKSFAKKHGHENIDIIDANIEALDHLGQPEQVQRLRDYALKLLQRAQEKTYLDGAEQIQYTLAWLTQAAVHPSGIASAFSFLRNKSNFFNVESYKNAVDTIGLWVRCLSLWGYPGDISANFTLRNQLRYNVYSASDMTNADILRRCSGPFIPYYESTLFSAVQSGKYDVIGINVTYVSQLPYALWLAQTLKEVSPSSFLVLGGTEISDNFKYASDLDVFQKMFNAADACVIGDGETCFVHILDSIADGRVPSPADNLLLHPRHRIDTDAVHTHRLRYEDLSQIPTPDYSQLPVAKYLSPEPCFHYSPSRGCYWGKCSFCDFGPSLGSATAPWRCASVDKIIDDLRDIARQTRYVYFAVDAMAPSTLVKVAERLIVEGLALKWAIEIRPESSWSREHCDLLKRSGCVCVSIGFESGNQRILDLMNKGTRIENIKAVMENFARAGIGVEIMGFTGFPSETPEEAMETVEFLWDHRPFWTFGGLGQFVMLSGSAVAQNHQRFGITQVHRFRGNDVHRTLHYADPVQKIDQDPTLKSRLEVARTAVGKRYGGPPFLGGLDSAHTIMYHDYYGTSVMDAVNARSIPEQIGADTRVSLNGSFAASWPGFEPDILINVLDNLRERTASEGRALSHDDLSEYLAGLRFEKQPDTRLYFVRKDGSYIPLTPQLSALLAEVGNYSRLDEILGSLGNAKDEILSNLSLLGFALRNRLVIAQNLTCNTDHQ